MRCLCSRRILGLLTVGLLAAGTLSRLEAQTMGPLLRRSLNAAPQAPTIPQEQPRELRTAGAVSSTSLVPTSFSVNPANREESRTFYRTIYFSSENVASGWTGNVANGSAGSTGQAFRDAVLRRVNYFRALAGIPAGVTFSNTYNAKDQQAALMMSANDALDHTPPSSWTYYTAEGAEAAENSNLFLGDYGVGSISGYIEDFGAENAAVGHRRWILYPQTRSMGTGDIVASSSFAAANALWIVDANYGGTRPPTRADFVAWPPPGFVPYPVVYPRWSFSYQGGDFSVATVAMKRSGASVPVRIDSRANGYGEPTIIWVPDNQNTDTFTPTPPSADTPLQVTVSGVKVNGVARSFSYTVTVFDPDKSGADTVLPTLSGPANPAVGVASTYTSAAVPRATGYQFRTAPLQAWTGVEGAENGTANVSTDVPDGYSVVGTAYHAGGARAFHLTTPDFGHQSVTLNATVVPGSAATLTFKSMFGYATSRQVAQVQTSLDEGVSWQTLWTRAGNGTGPGAFSSEQVALGAFAKRALRVRFLFSYVYPGSAYPQTDSIYGWYFDDVAFTDSQVLSSAQVSGVQSGTAFNFTPPAAGDWAIQTRAQFYNAYPFEWGPVKTLPVGMADALPLITTQPKSVTAPVDGPVKFSVVVTSGTTASYQWFKGTTLLNGATAASYEIANVQPAQAGSYLVKITNHAGTKTSQTVTLTVTIPKPVVTTAAAVVVSGNALKFSGQVEVHGQTVNCGFQYGSGGSLASTVDAGSAATAQTFQTTVQGLTPGVIYQFRAFAKTSDGTRYVGATRSVTLPKQPATLTVTISPPDSGTVSVAPAGALSVGTAVTLTARPAAGKYFTGWTGGQQSAATKLSFTMPATLQLTASFAPNPALAAAGSYRGLVLTSPTTHAACGLLVLTATGTGSFSGRTVIGGTTRVFTGAFNPDGSAHFGPAEEALLARGVGQTPLRLTLHFNITAGVPQEVVGEVRSDEGTMATLKAPRAFFRAALNPPAPWLNVPAAWLGAYTVAFDPKAPVAPGVTGRGWATVKISTAGVARFSGKLADGTAFLANSPLAKDGTLPAFVLLRAGKGSAFGTVTVMSGSPTTLAGTWQWFRPAGVAGQRFASGWPTGAGLTLHGAGYEPPVVGVDYPLPGLATATLKTSGGALAAALQWSATFSLIKTAVTVPPNAVGPATLSLSPAVGTLRGTFKPKAGSAAISYSGVLLREEGLGAGFFLDAAGGGRVELKP